MRNPHGYLRDGETERDVIRCCHCQRICEVPPGPLTTFPWCWSCSAPTCQSEACQSRCDPWEAKLEREEARERLWRAVV